MARRYDKELKLSAVGQSLYPKWVRMRKMGCCNAWVDDFEAFAEWAIATGFEGKETLKRRISKEEFSPQNCYWVEQEGTTKKTRKVYVYPSYKDSEFRVRWDKTVNRIRKHYGLEPFELEAPDYSDRTCKDCVHYKVCKYKANGVPICEDYLD